MCKFSTEYGGLEMLNSQELIRELRKGYTQEQIAERIGVSRETFSRYETGRIEAPTSILKRLAEEFDNPIFSLQVQAEFTGTGTLWLDGPNVDLHRSAVKEKTLEEMQEAIDQLEKTSLVKPLWKIEHFEKQNIEETLDELVEAQTAIDHLVAVICMEAGINYVDLWQKHYRSLASNGYLALGGV